MFAARGYKHLVVVLVFPTRPWYLLRLIFVNGVLVSFFYLYLECLLFTFVGSNMQVC